MANLLFLPPMKFWKRLFVALCTGLVLAFTPQQASSQVSREAELKAKMVAIVLQNYITWPTGKKPTEAKPLTIGIVGDDPFADANGASHLERQLKKAVILKFADHSDYKDCHVLVVSKKANFEKSYEKAKGAQVLVVSESPGLAKKGAAVNLVFDMANNKIRLQVNPTTANAAGIKIDSALFRVAEIVN